MQRQIQSFRRHLRLAFIVPVLLAAMLGGVFALQTYYLRNSMEQVQHSYLIQNRSRTILKYILDMETGLRGYLLTGQYTFLQPYRNSQPQVKPAFDELQGILRDDPYQIRELQRMRADYNDWFDFSQSMIALRQQSGPVENVELNLREKKMMDELRASRDQILAREEQRLDARVGNVQRTVISLFVTGAVLSLLMGLLIATFSRRELARVAATFGRALVTGESRRKELETSQRWLGAVLGSIGDGVLATDLAGKIAFSNPVAQSLLGRSADELNGLSTSEVVQAVEEFSRDRAPDPFAAVMRTGERFAVSDHIVLMSRNGTEIPIAVSAQPMQNETGENTGVVIVLRDLTDQRQSERTLQSAEKLASIGRIAASVAHEIHNPLDAVGNLLYLLEHGSLDDTSKTYVRLAKEELERISNISEQMLTFSRESRQPLAVNLGEVIDNVLTLFAARIRRLGVVVVKQYQTSKTVFAFPGEMRQVFSNLVGNALDAMNGPGTLTIKVEDARLWNGGKAAGIRVLVCDNGSGIPDEVRPRLMDPFVTSKGEKGTGLGLWVSRGIVEKYQGNLRFRTSTNPRRSGTCFAVFLPERAAAAISDTNRDAVAADRRAS